MDPVAILSVLVKAQGIDTTNKQLRDLDANGKRAGDSTSKMEQRFSSADGTFKSFNRTLQGTSGAVSSVKFPALIAGAGLAIEAFGALAADSIALVSALAPLSGLAGAGAVGLTAFGQAAGVAALASMGVGDALQEQAGNHAKLAKAAASAATQQKSASDAIVAAQDGVKSAQDQVRQASEALQQAQLGEKNAALNLTEAQQGQIKALSDLAGARQQAKRSLQDMESSVAKAYLTEKQAVQTLTDAQKALADASQPASAEKLASAQSTLTNSTLSEQRAVMALTDARQKLADLLKPVDSLTLADAQDAVADATRGETRAQLDLAKAQKAANDAAANPTLTDDQRAQAALDLADAQDAVGDAARNSAHAQQQLQKLQAGPDPADVAKATLDVASAQQAVADASTNTASAAQALQDAQKGPDPQAIAKAQLDVADAEQQVADATRDRARQQKDLNAAEKAGVNGSPQVIAAREAIVSANRDVTQSEQAVKDAHRQTADAQRSLTAAGAGVVKALGNVKDAQDAAKASATSAAAANVDLNQKFNDLPPAAQSFVKVLLKLKPRLDDLRATAAAGLFPGVTEGIGSAMKSFDAVEHVTGKTATTLGDLSKRAGELVGSKGFGNDLETVGDRNALIISRVGRAAINAGDALRHIVVTAGPLTTWLAKLTLEWSKNLDASVKSARDSGDLSKFFQKTRNTLIRVVDIVKNLAVAFFNVGKASAPFGRQLLADIDQITKKFADWASSIGGQKKLTQFFKETTALSEKLAPAVGKAAGSLGGMAFKVLPAYIRLLGLLGPLTGPAIQAFAAFKLASAGAAITGGIVGGITALTRSYKLLASGVKFSTAAEKENAFAVLAAKAATIVASAATKAWTGLQWALNAALDANPIGLIVLAIGALVLGIIEAYKHSEKFRDIVNSVWDAIKSVAKPVIDWLSHAVPDAFNALKDAAGAVVGWLKDNWPLVLGILTGPFGLAVVEIIQHWGDISDFFSALPGRIVDLIKAVPKLLGDAGSWVLDQIVAGFEAVTGLLAGAGGWVLKQFLALIHAEATGLLSLGSWLLDKIISGFRAVTGLLAGAGSWLGGQVIGLVHAVADDLVGLGSWVLDKIVGGFKTVTKLLGSIGGWLFEQLEAGVHALSDGVSALGGWVLATLVNGLTYISDKGVSGVTEVGDWLLKQLTKVINGLKDGVTGLGGTIIGWIVDGLKTGANLLVDFLNEIIKVINLLPDVKIKSIAKFSDDKGGGSAKTQAFAKGGISGGGFVNAPMIMMGEDAPSHPEFVIPTNPAYRKRAHGLLASAAQAIGYASGGVFSQGEMEQLWVKAGGPSDQAKVAGAVGEAESSGRQYARGPMTQYGQALGLMQILGQVVPGDIFDPLVNFKNAVSKWKAAGGWSPWEAYTGPDGRGADGPYLQFMGGGGGGGILNTIGHAISGAANALNPLKLIGDLPSTDGLGWLKGTGSYVIDKVKDYITGAISSVIPGGGGGGESSGPDGVGTFRGFPMADWVIASLKYAEKKLGTVLQPTSGWRSQAEQDAIRARDPRAAKVSEHLGKVYPHGAVDFGGFNDAHAKVIKDAVVAATADFKWPLLAPTGFVDDGHASGTGHAMGGVIARMKSMGGSPFTLGSYEHGTPYVPQTGPYLLHKGESVTPASGRHTGPLVNIENATFAREEDPTILARQLGWQLAR